MLVKIEGLAVVSVARGGQFALVSWHSGAGSSQVVALENRRRLERRYSTWTR